ncbi:hypothetical protein ACFQZZ_06220 [Nocardia sp. GCM10030253]|uniref:hypothetical protein n=1 Tax=Nocardia sp. GCM10030253 TaxID=3273404 RepID=UPI00362D2173
MAMPQKVNDFGWGVIGFVHDHLVLKSPLDVIALLGSGTASVTLLYRHHYIAASLLVLLRHGRSFGGGDRSLGLAE